MEDKTSGPIEEGEEEAEVSGTNKEGMAEQQQQQQQEEWVERRTPVLCAASSLSLPEHALSGTVAYFLKLSSFATSLTLDQLDRDISYGILPKGLGMSTLEKVGCTPSISLSLTLSTFSLLCCACSLSVCKFIHFYTLPSFLALYMVFEC